MAFREVDRDSSIQLSQGQSSSGTLQWAIDSNQDSGEYTLRVKSDNDTADTSVFVGIPDSAIAHYDATQISAADGDSISTWADSIGSFDITGGGPLFSENSQNGNAVVDYDGSNDVLNETNAVISQPYTVILVGQFANSGDGEAIISSNNSNKRTFLSNGSTGSSWRFFTDTGEITGGTPDSNPHIFTVIADGASSKLRVDGAELNNTDIGTQNFEGIRQGQRSDGGGRYHAGWIGENLFYDANLETDGTLSDEETRLSDKWGITI